MVDISVILPVYNTERYLKEAIQSIVDQTFENWELILIDDASTDGSLEVARSFRDRRIRIVQNPSNIKVVKSLNLGIRFSAGRYIARMDADDIAHPMRFEKQFRYLEANEDVALCGTWVQSIGSDRRIIRAPLHHDQIQASFLFHNVIVHPSVMFRREAFINAGLMYDETFSNAEDYGLWVRAIERFRFANIEEVLLKYRVHDLNVSVFKEENRDELDRMHYRIYAYYLDVLEVSYTQEELDMHRKIGLRALGRLKGKELECYLNWIGTVYTANKKKAYFENSALSYVLISNLLHIGKAAEPGMRNYVRCLSHALSLFGFGGLIKYAAGLLMLKARRAEHF